MTRPRPTRWNVPLAGGLLAISVGVLFGEPTLLLLAVPFIVFVAYSGATPRPAPSLEVERSMSTETPSNGQAVEITTVVRNVGDRPLFDVRIADGVPRLLAVERGSARHAAVLGPGDETCFSYTVVATPGVHRFEPATILVTDPSGGVEFECEGHDGSELTCLGRLSTLPIDRPVRPRTGEISAGGRGSGLEFSDVRTYRPGDPWSRIDWNRYARSGEPATVSFVEEERRTVVLCLDAREACYRSPDGVTPHAVAYETAAAHELLGALEGGTVPIGLAVIGASIRWIPPESGVHHVATIRRVLEESETLPTDPDRPGGTRNEIPEDRVRGLQNRFEDAASVVFCSPLIDEFAVTAIRVLESGGSGVTVISPDVTVETSLGTAITSVRRENRIESLRRSGVTTIDWSLDTPLETAIRTQTSHR